MSQKIKTFSLYSIKRLFKLILLVFLFLFYFLKSFFSKENNPEDYNCEVSNLIIEKDVISLSLKIKKFNKVISKLRLINAR
jgi:hypothetical protein